MSLKKNYKWDPAFILGDEEMGRWAEKNLESCLFHDAMSLRRLDIDFSNLKEIFPVDSDILSKLARFESNYFNWLQETAESNFTFRQRRKYFYNILTFWNSIINQVKPSLFVAYTWPHTPGDYPLYLLCKYVYNIPVLFLEYTPYFDQKNYAISTSLENLSASFTRIYSSKNELPLSKIVSDHLEELRSNDAKRPDHIEQYERILDEELKNFSFWRSLFKGILSGNLFKKAQVSFKKNKSFETSSFSMSNMEYLLFQRKMISMNRNLSDQYKVLTKKLNLDEDYIYFAAPYQPEANSNIAVGVYEDVELMIQMISKAKPKGWKILYKEHPTTFFPTSKGCLERDNIFYKNLSEIEDVVFVPVSTSTFDLIDNSRAVCTAGGTVGWEALVRGKPSIIFGALWYQKCKSVFSISTLQDLKKAFLNIKEGFLPSEEDIDRFAESVYRSTYSGLIRINDIDEYHEEDEQILIEVTSKAIYNEFCRHYDSNSPFDDPYMIRRSN